MHVHVQCPVPVAMYAYAGLLPVTKSRGYRLLVTFAKTQSKITITSTGFMQCSATLEDMKRAQLDLIVMSTWHAQNFGE